MNPKLLMTITKILCIANYVIAGFGRFPLMYLSSFPVCCNNVSKEKPLWISGCFYLRDWNKNRIC